MRYGTEGSRQGEHPTVLKASTQIQPDQTAFEKHEWLLAYNRAYYLKRREQASKRNRNYVHQHRKQLNAKRRIRYEQNPVPFLTATQKWIAKNRERPRASQKAWYQEHQERVLMKRRLYYQEHREQENERQRLSYKRQVGRKLQALLDGL
jgi:hypothetical protein